MTKQLDDTIIKKYTDGMSTYDIATEYGTYPNAIIRFLDKKGVKRRSKSDAQKVAIDQGRSIHPTKGRTRTEEEKLKISKSTVDHRANLSDEERQKKQLVSKQIWEQIPPEKKEEMKKKANEKIRLAAKYGSKLEKAIQDALVEEGVLYESHKKNLISSQKLEIDLYLPAYRTIIEVDGLSHFEPIWGEDSLQKQQLYDSQKDGIILSKGFNIIRIENVSSSLAIAKLVNLKNEILSILQEIKNNKLTSTTRVIKYE